MYVLPRHTDLTTPTPEGGPPMLQRVAVQAIGRCSCSNVVVLVEDETLDNV